MAPISFKDSQEAALRRFIRSIIRVAPDLTKSERLVTIAIANHYFHHKAKRQPIHPGLERLARAAGRVSLKTVSRTIKKLKAAEVIIVHSNERGGPGTPMRFFFNTRALIVLCGCDLPDELSLTPSWFVPVESAKMSRLNDGKMSDSIKNSVRRAQAKDDDDQGEVPF